MFESVFDGVPPELRRILEGQIERAVLEAVRAAREASAVDRVFLACALRMSEIMLLAGAIGHGSRGRKPRKDRDDGSDAVD